MPLLNVELISYSTKSLTEIKFISEFSLNKPYYILMKISELLHGSEVWVDLVMEQITTNTVVRTITK